MVDDSVVLGCSEEVVCWVSACVDAVDWIVVDEDCTVVSFSLVDTASSRGVVASDVVVEETSVLPAVEAIDEDEVRVDAAEVCTTSVVMALVCTDPVVVNDVAFSVEEGITVV